MEVLEKAWKWRDNLSKISKRDKVQNLRYQQSQLCRPSRKLRRVFQIDGGEVVGRGVGRGVHTKPFVSLCTVSKRSIYVQGQKEIIIIQWNSQCLLEIGKIMSTSCNQRLSTKSCWSMMTQDKNIVYQNKAVCSATNKEKRYFSSPRSLKLFTRCK